MPRFFIHLAYKGTKYCGWQVQPNALSVQGTVEHHLSVLLREKISIVGAGRTDTGVHARNFYAHFDSSNVLLDNTKDFSYKLNRFLPNDIKIFGIYKVHNEAHARFDAVSRMYKYYIAREKEIFLDDYCWQKNTYLNVMLMNSAALKLLDFTDFTSFSKLHTDVKTNNCKVMEAHWEIENGFSTFTIKADRFLRNMVRSIVGTLIDIGMNRMTLSEFIQVIEKRDRAAAGVSVPAQGLFLEEIEYPYNIKDN